MLEATETTTDVRAVVTAHIRELLTEGGEPAPEITGTAALHELGLSSLMLARLLIHNENALDVDPFTEGDAVISDIRTVDDLVAAYETALATARAA